MTIAEKKHQKSTAHPATSMVKLGLFLQADLDGVTSVSPVDTTDNPYFYTFKVQCNSCHEINENWVTISRQVCISIHCWMAPHVLGEG